MCVCACVYVCMYTVTRPSQAPIHAGSRTVSMRVCVCVCQNVHVCMYTVTWLSNRQFMQISHSQYIYVYVCACACAHLCTCVCLYICIHTYILHTGGLCLQNCVSAVSLEHTHTHTHIICMHTCIHAYMHTCIHTYRGLVPRELRERSESGMPVPVNINLTDRREEDCSVCMCV